VKLYKQNYLSLRTLSIYSERGEGTEALRYSDPYEIDFPILSCLIVRAYLAAVGRSFPVVLWPINQPPFILATQNKAEDAIADQNL